MEIVDWKNKQNVEVEKKVQTYILENVSTI